MNRSHHQSRDDEPAGVGVPLQHFSVAMPGPLNRLAHATLPFIPSLPCFKFFLPLHCPLSGQVFVYVAGAGFASQKASGKSLCMWPGVASPERLRRPPPSLPCFKFFLLYTAPLQRPWASLCICPPALKPFPGTSFKIPSLLFCSLYIAPSPDSGASSPPLRPPLSPPFKTFFKVFHLKPSLESPL